MSISIKTTHTGYVFDDRPCRVSLDNECEIPEFAEARVSITMADDELAGMLLTSAEIERLERVRGTQLRRLDGELLREAARQCGCGVLVRREGEWFATYLPTARQMGVAAATAWYGRTAAVAGFRAEFREVAL